MKSEEGLEHLPDEFAVKTKEFWQAKEKTETNCFIC